MGDSYMTEGNTTYGNNPQTQILLWEKGTVQSFSKAIKVGRRSNTDNSGQSIVVHDVRPLDTDSATSDIRGLDIPADDEADFGGSDGPLDYYG